MKHPFDRPFSLRNNKVNTPATPLFSLTEMMRIYGGFSFYQYRSFPECYSGKCYTTNRAGVVAKPQTRRPGGCQGPELIEFTGFRVKHGMTKKKKSINDIVKTLIEEQT
jgi:hypothetical protein